MSFDHKDIVRQRVWPRLREVAIADSRFHYDFSSFIADFEGSGDAVRRIVQLPCFQHAKVVFITPDNCLEELRYEALEHGKLVLVTTYAIRRGFFLLDPRTIDTSEKRRQASLLDAMERPGMANAVSLRDLKEQNLKVDVLVTGTGAINGAGIRLGKGHGFFDLEFAMLLTLGLVNMDTPCVAIVHDCQIVDENILTEEFDTVCDFVVTPSKVIEVGRHHAVKKPTCGVLWERLQENMLGDIPPLRELQSMVHPSEQ